MFSINTILGIQSDDEDASDRPDLINTGNHSIYEIKTVRGQAAGYADLDHYLITLNRLDPHGDIWTPGTADIYTPPSELVLSNGDDVTVNPPVDGVITYEVNRTDDDYAIKVLGFTLAVVASTLFYYLFGPDLNSISNPGAPPAPVPAI